MTGAEPSVLGSSDDLSQVQQSTGVNAFGDLLSSAGVATVTPPSASTATAMGDTLHASNPGTTSQAAGVHFDASIATTGTNPPGATIAASVTGPTDGVGTPADSVQGGTSTPSTPSSAPATPVVPLTSRRLSGSAGSDSLVAAAPAVESAPLVQAAAETSPSTNLAQAAPLPGGETQADLSSGNPGVTASVNNGGPSLGALTGGGAARRSGSLPMIAASVSTNAPAADAGLSMASPTPGSVRKQTAVSAKTTGSTKGARADGGKSDNLAAQAALAGLPVVLGVAPAPVQLATAPSGDGLNPTVDCLPAASAKTTTPTLSPTDGSSTGTFAATAGGTAAASAAGLPSSGSNHQSAAGLTDPWMLLPSFRSSPGIVMPADGSGGVSPVTLPQLMAASKRQAGPAQSGGASVVLPEAGTGQGIVTVVSVAGDPALVQVVAQALAAKGMGSAPTAPTVSASPAPTVLGASDHVALQSGSPTGLPASSTKPYGMQGSGAAPASAQAGAVQQSDFTAQHSVPAPRGALASSNSTSVVSGSIPATSVAASPQPAANAQGAPAIATVQAEQSAAGSQGPTPTALSAKPVSGSSGGSAPTVAGADSGGSAISSLSQTDPNQSGGGENSGASKKDFQPFDEKGKTASKSFDGISAASNSDVMSSSRNPSHDAVYAAEPAVAASSSTDAASRAAAGHPAPPPSTQANMVGTVSRTLEVVRDVSERIQAKAAQTVNFSVSFRSGEQLSVSLEYRGGVVHTTFNTDSSELRNAIARDWQAQMPSSSEGDHSVRLADPVFSNASSAHNSLDLGGQPRQQQQTFQQQTAQESAQRSQAFPGSPRTARRESSRQSGNLDDVPATLSAVSDTSRHLHTFA